MFTSLSNLQIVHDKLGTMARDLIFLEKKLESQHPDLYKQISLDLDRVIQSIHSIRHEMLRYNNRLTHKNFLK